LSGGVLILGGTGDAVSLARLLAPIEGLDVVTSLAGRTRNPAQVPGRLRTGGFGGVGGLSDYLRAENVQLLVDATHPYAANISANAAAACTECGVSRLQLWRAPWPQVDADRWIDVRSMSEAAAHVASCQFRSLDRVFVTTGVTQLDVFQAIDGVTFLLRCIEKPVALPAIEHVELIFGRGPFHEADELALLAERNVTLLVSKNSGGAATYGKISAARKLRIPVIMVARPAPENGPVVHSPEEALLSVRRQLGA
jgi:precorrin-6A/cobalt-precorrin-6A reductase